MFDLMMMDRVTQFLLLAFVGGLGLLPCMLDGCSRFKLIAGTVCGFVCAGSFLAACVIPFMTVLSVR